MFNTNLIKGPTNDELRGFAQFRDLMDSIVQGKTIQQSQVYYWEQEVLRKEGMDMGSMSQAETQNLVNRVLADFGMGDKHCEVNYVRTLPVGNTARTMYNIKTHEQKIEMNGLHASMYTVLHECAHVLLNFHCYDDSEEGHGPDYVRVFCELAARFGGLNLQGCINSAKETGVAVNDSMPCGLEFREAA